jgi:hypothetical protein
MIYSVFPGLLRQDNQLLSRAGKWMAYELLYSPFGHLPNIYTDIVTDSVSN